MWLRRRVAACEKGRWSRSASFSPGEPNITRIYDTGHGTGKTSSVKRPRFMNFDRQTQLPRADNDCTRLCGLPQATDIPISVCICAKTVDLLATSYVEIHLLLSDRIRCSPPPGDLVNVYAIEDCLGGVGAAARLT